MRVFSSPRFLPLASLSCALGLIVLWALESWVGEANAPLSIVTYAPQHGWALGPLLLGVWALKRRRWRSVGINALALFCWALCLMKWNVPARLAEPSPAPGDVPLRVMSFNIVGGIMGLSRVADEVRRHRPDVVCMQETMPFVGGPAKPVPVLRKELADYHVVRAGEVAVFSRFPILNTTSYPLPGTQRAFLDVTLDLRGRRVRVFCVHLTTLNLSAAVRCDWQEVTNANDFRRRQIAALLDLTQGIQEPLLVVGDFNTPPRGRHYARLSRRWREAWREAGWGTGQTFHSKLPVVRIDYVWMSREWRVRNCFVPRVFASDHRPLVANLWLR